MLPAHLHYIVNLVRYVERHPVNIHDDGGFFFAVVIFVVRRGQHYMNATKPCDIAYNGFFKTDFFINNFDRCSRKFRKVTFQRARDFPKHTDVGDSVALLVKVENMPFRDAVEVITGVTPITSPTLTHRNSASAPAHPPKTLILPENSGTNNRLYKYLCWQRRIDKNIVDRLIQKEMLYEDSRGNVVFVGYDEHNKPRFACLRGTRDDCDYRGDCAGSDKRYGFSVAAYIRSERLYLYESDIDLMSHASIENYLPFDVDAWQDHHRLSLAGITDTAIPFFLNQHREVKELVFCLDNDPAGREAAVSMARKYADKGYHTRLELPQGKEFNEDLCKPVQAEKAVKRRYERSI